MDGDFVTPVFPNGTCFSVVMSCFRVVVSTSSSSHMRLLVVGNLWKHFDVLRVSHQSTDPPTTTQYNLA